MRKYLAALASFAATLALAACVQAPLQAPRQDASPSPAAQFVSEVHRKVLANGLTVLHREQKGSGIVAINTYVKAGYFHEPDQVAGMAHLFEHMFFKGSRAYPGPSAIARAISESGGRTNASTIYDHTSYYVVLPREGFVRGVEVQADAIAHPLFDAAELKKEAEVVIEESNRKLDNPGPVAFERMLATSFTEHRIRRWRIGSDEVLRNIRRDDLVAFFETLYRPENIVVSVVGDVGVDEAFATVEKHFGAIPRGAVKKERGPKEPQQAAFRFGRSEADIQDGYAVFGWQTVGEGHRDEAALDMLALVLGRGRSSRLAGAVNPREGTSVSASHANFEDVGILSITAVMPEANRARTERRVISEVERIKAHGPTAFELARARNVSRSSFLAGMESALGQAQLLSQFEAQGSYRDVVTHLDRLQAVTADDVRDVARRYLAPERLTLYQYQRKGAEASTASQAWARVQEGVALATAERRDYSIPDQRNSVRSADADTPLTVARLANGATLAIRQRVDAPRVATGIYLRGGRIQEDAGNAGITRLMLHTLRRGTRSRDEDSLDREVEFLGTQLGTVLTEDGFGLTFTTSATSYEPVMALAGQVLATPAFPDAGIARERSQQLAVQRRELDSAAERAAQLLRGAMYEGHPYALPEAGTPATLAKLDRAALVDWWKKTVAADRVLVVVVGNVNAEDVRRVVEAQLAALPASAGALVLPPAPRAPSAPREAVESRERKQTAMLVGFPTVPPSHPDYATMRIMATMTSGIGGTIWQELRGVQSLAYSLATGPRMFAQAGMYVGSLAGEASKEAQARAGLLAEMRRLAGPGANEDDVARARSQFVGNARIGRETSAALVAEYGRNYLWGLPLDAFDGTIDAASKVHASDVHRVARSYFTADNHVYAAVRGSAAASR